MPIPATGWEGLVSESLEWALDRGRGLRSLVEVRQEEIDSGEPGEMAPVGLEPCCSSVAKDRWVFS